MTEVNILGCGFLVEEVEMGEDQAGNSCHADRTIHLSKNLVESAQVETFYHEWVHVVLGMGGYSELLDEKMEEALAQYLGVALMHLVSYNNTLPALGVKNDQA